MATGLFRDYLSPDDVVTVNASGTGLTISKGDWVAYSGAYAIAANTGVASYKASGIGVALANNPTYDELGVIRVNTALPVATRGLFRVSGVYSSPQDGTDITLGIPVCPASTSSGIVGQTGATGVGPCWLTAALVRISSNPTGALASGIGKLVAFYKAGDVSANEFDIQILPQRPDYF